MKFYKLWQGLQEEVLNDAGEETQAPKTGLGLACKYIGMLFEDRKVRVKQR